MLAKYKGTCSQCGGPIEVGQDISWSRQERGKAYHVACKEPSATRVSAPATPSTPASTSDAELLAALKALLAKREQEEKASLPVATPETTSPETPRTTKPTPASTTVPVESKESTKRTKIGIRSNAPWYDVFSAVLPVCNRILLVGPPSSGKSTTAMIEAKTAHRVTMTETTSREDLIGMFHLIDGETKWIDGPMTCAMREGQSVLIDEIDRYSPECASLLYSLIDDRPHISLPTGELVEAKDGYKVIMTTNETVDSLPVAVQDRIQVIIQASLPHEAALIGMPEAGQTIVMRYYKAQPVKTTQLFPTVRRMKTFYLLKDAGFPNELAASLVFGTGAKEVLSAITSVEGNK